MDAHIVDEVNSTNSEVGSSALRSNEELSLKRETMKEVGGAAMVLTKVEMDIVCSSEKLCNLNVLMMKVSTRESELEASVSVKEEIPTDHILEFNLLCGILDSEVKELDNFFCSLHKELIAVREIILSTSSEHMEEAFKLFEEKLHDSDESLKQSQEQLEYTKMQSADLQKSLSFFWNQCDYAKDVHVSGRNQHIEDKVHMQTREQQTNVLTLRQLDNSIARELELDMKLKEARQIEEELKLRLHSSCQEASYLEEEATDSWAQYLEAESAAVVLTGISKDLLGQLQMFQFNMNCLTQNRDELRSNQEDLAMQLEKKSAEVNVLRTEVTRLNKNIEDFEVELSAANCRAETAEAQCNVLEETNVKLNEELNHLKHSSSIEKESLEKQLKDLDHELQHTLATAEASQENQIMLNSMVGDMENLIQDLKAKVLNAECRADGAEAKCRVFSESNVALNEELSFLRNRLEILEASVHETNDLKIESAKKIEMRAKVITSLVMQLAMERDRLHEQLTSLAKENKLLCVRLQTANKGQYGAVDSSKQECVGCSPSANESNSANKDRNSEMSNGKSKAKAGNASSTSELETVRRIDAGTLNVKHLIVALVVLVISVAAYSFLNSNSPL
ncbi:unnamed protein product [Rhodiola kirilowii]